MLALLPLVGAPVSADDQPMFSAHCEAEGTVVLLPARAIESIDNDDGGMVVHWRCRCGHRGSFRTGQPRPARLGAA